MFSIKTIIAVAMGVTAVAASDVYATFYSSEGQIAPNFDVGNPGCFAIDAAVQVSFNQHANGPYCLHGWASGYCPSDTAPATQGFSSLDAGPKYAIATDLQYAASYMWTLGNC